MAVVKRVRFFLKRVSERLWVRPLAACLLSIAGVALAKAADRTQFHEIVPSITAESIDSLLALMGASMLVIATFAVASMVAAYGSASSAATPRSFTLVVADDVSQNALSIFVGSFIFSIVARTALKNGYFMEASRAALFIVTALVFAIVIITFVRWVDRIARLGRLSTSIDKVEDAATAALEQRRVAPTLGGVALQRQLPAGEPVNAPSIGYVQRVDIATLQACAEAEDLWIAVAALPGTFAVPGRPLAYVGRASGAVAGIDHQRITAAFTMGRERLFDEDPRFGLVVLAEIGDRALSPGINDPGTAIAVLGSFNRLFASWSQPAAEPATPEYDRVEVPVLSVQDMFDDAFTAIARDGAGAVEVMTRLQKTLASLASVGDHPMRAAAMAHARLALARAEQEMALPADLAVVRAAAAFARLD